MRCPGTTPIVYVDVAEGKRIFRVIDLHDAVGIAGEAENRATAIATAGDPEARVSTVLRRLILVPKWVAEDAAAATEIRTCSDRWFNGMAIESIDGGVKKGDVEKEMKERGHD